MKSILTLIDVPGEQKQGVVGEIDISADFFEHPSLDHLLKQHMQPAHENN